MLRQDIRFLANGVELAGWLYRPNDGQGPFPAIVLTHGFGALKEMGLDDYASRFCEAGFVCLVYDHRNTGGSGGDIRGELDPWHQIDDMRDAITYLAMQPMVDPQRIGLWGTSYSGGHVLVVAATDRRVKCVVSQVPTVSGYINTLRSIPAEQFQAFLDSLAQERISRAQGAPPAYVPISVEGSDSFAWSSVAGKGTGYVNAVTLLSRELRMAYEPGIYLPRIAPTPLLMIIATSDTRCPTDSQLAGYATALEPKRLVLVAGGHYSPYTTQLETASNEALRWFVQHLSFSQCSGKEGV